jgi:hypothetical protein
MNFKIEQGIYSSLFVKSYIVSMKKEVSLNRYIKMTKIRYKYNLDKIYKILFLILKMILL